MSCECGRVSWHLHGDGIVDETDAVQHLMNTGQQLPPGRYRITRTIYLGGDSDGLGA